MRSSAYLVAASVAGRLGPRCAADFVNSKRYDETLSEKVSEAGSLPFYERSKSAGERKTLRNLVFTRRPVGPHSVFY